MLALKRRLYLPVLLIVVLGPAAGCSLDTQVGGPGSEGSSSPGGGNEPGSAGTPELSDEALPDFSLADVNLNSLRYREAVSPRDYLGQISAWYFGHST